VAGVIVAPTLVDRTGAALRSDLETRVPGLKVAVLGADDAATVAALDLPPDEVIAAELSGARLVQSHVAALAGKWLELCRWDPMLPPDVELPLAEEFVYTIALALAEPQPLGWGPDPDVERVAERFAEAVGGLEVAMGALVCLRTVLTRTLVEGVPAEVLGEVMARSNMVVDRALQVVAAETTDRLQREALVDPLTGLLNRRALERDARREVGRAARYGNDFSMIVIDLDGLKAVNDTDGHLAGDIRLRLLATCLKQSLRTSDSAYRIGGDEFVILLPEMDHAGAAAVAGRIEEAGAPPFSWGSALFGPDGDDINRLIDAADQRLFESRRRQRKPTRA